jgi:hypothetical protein
VKERGRLAIESDVLIREHKLNERQAIALRHILVEGELSIQRYAELLPNVNRRTLQRDLKDMVDKRLLIVAGATLYDKARRYLDSRLYHGLQALYVSQATGGVLRWS